MNCTSMSEQGCSSARPIEPARPDLFEELIDPPRAQVHERVGGCAGEELRLDLLVGLLERRTKRFRAARVVGEGRGEGGGVERGRVGGRGVAAHQISSSGHLVSTSKPLSVTNMVCSHCAERL